MDPLSLVVGGASLVGSIFSSKKSSDDSAASRQWQSEQIDKQNAYNTPSAQRARFEQAGFNPYFSMGNIANGNMTTNLS